MSIFDYLLLFISLITLLMGLIGSIIPVIPGPILAYISIIILRPASETGQLYGSVSTRDIANEVLNKGFSITHKQVVLQKTVKELGLQKINISLHPEVLVEIKLNVARTIEEAQIQEKTGEAIIDKKIDNEKSNFLTDDAVDDVSLDEPILEENLES